MIKIPGLLTSRIETRTKDKETYYYGFFRLEGQEPEIPVIFKGNKPILEKDSQVELTGQWANSSKERPSFTCHTCRLIAEPEPLTITSLQKTLQPLLSTCLEKKQEWTERTDFFFKKKKDLEEIERMTKLGSTYLKAYLLTKQAFYANYQTEHLAQANFNLETYLQRIAAELDRESQHIQGYLSKESVNQSFANLANNSLQITLQALNEKDLTIKNLEQKLANCKCQKQASKKENIAKFRPIYNSSDLLDQMTEDDIENLKHGCQGASGHGDGVAGFCMWCGDEFTNLAVSHEVVRFKKKVGSCYPCFTHNLNKEHRTLEEQVRFMWNNWREFKKKEVTHA